MSSAAEYIQTVLEELADGRDDSEIADLMGLDAAELANAKRAALSQLGKSQGDMSKEERFAEYFLAQRRNIRACNDLLVKLDASKQYNTMVSAIRLRSDLEGKILEAGFELGVIAKTPERREVIAGLVVRDMSDDELKRGIIAEFRKFTAMLKRHGETGMMDVPVGPTHYGPRVLPPVVEVRPTARRAKVGRTKGRSRSRERAA